MTRSRAPTGLVGLHQRLVDVVVGDVGVSVRLLPLVQLLLDGAQGVVDLRGRGVGPARRLLRLGDFLTHICSSRTYRIKVGHKPLSSLYAIKKS